MGSTLTMVRQISYVHHIAPIPGILADSVKNVDLTPPFRYSQRSVQHAGPLLAQQLGAHPDAILREILLWGFSEDFGEDPAEMAGAHVAGASKGRYVQVAGVVPCNDLHGRG